MKVTTNDKRMETKLGGVSIDLLLKLALEGSGYASVMLNSYLTASHWIVTRARAVSARAPGGSWDDSIAEAEGLVGGHTASVAVTGPEVRPVRFLWAQTPNLWASGNREATLHGSQKRVGTTKLQGRSGEGTASSIHEGVCAPETW